MLSSRNLDDQSYQQIIEHAMGRLPWLCPDWTDHNAHDPGITLLELMSWYKELQQYHLNAVTDAMRRRLLNILGTGCKPGSPASCYIEFPPDAPPAFYPEGSRLLTGQGIVFELEEPAAAGGPVVKALSILTGGRNIDVTGMGEKTAVTPFSFGDEENTMLSIEFDRLEGGVIRIWFDIDPQNQVPRNPFEGTDYKPRKIGWAWDGDKFTEPLVDTTRELSISGYADIPVLSSGPLVLSLTEPGCEETVRIQRVATGRYSARQTETWSHLTF